jgi:photosystem II stability/assembly factor-like uncharacterized protein
MRYSHTLIALAGCTLGLSAPVAAQPAGKWEVQTSGVTDRLYDVTFANTQLGWAVGASNTILHTADGGKTWKRQVERNERGPTFHRVLFTDSKSGWVHTDILNNIRNTTDGGATWRDVPLPEPGAAGKAFCRVAIVGTTLTLQYAGFVYRTVDAGKSWQMLTDKFPVETPDQGEMWFADARTGCAVVGNYGVARTTDGGKTWQTSQLAKKGASIPPRVQLLDAKTGWAMPHFGTIHRTTDGGQTWEAADLGHRSTNALIDLHFVDANLGHVLVSGNNSIGEVRRTTDGGKTWALLGKLRNPDRIRGHNFPDADHGWVVGDKGYIEHYRAKK